MTRHASRRAILLFHMLLSVAVLYGCDQGKSSPDPSLALAVDDGVELRVSSNELAALFDDVEPPRPEVLRVPETAEEAERMNRPLGYQFDSFHIEGQGDLYYPVAKGKTEEGNCFTVARELA